ncbi:FAD-dependent oxidoreductase [Alkalispirochaeta sphaeroplastigenens]|uniref:FAD-dependent oxidoreductase n=1 Tax=Alkalispirochaeta sphaeroplastigenens TaxID=1187066 RepID=A0A2S4K0R5_9SPIO|nr:FAD-dependent oxidoreductase [Alkalispirochaeta sphaeroplastigenens]POR05351.1 FAD-dependent oxidoreductase [Alkalispirochaeta sphaeroplastigenens]
MSHGHVVVIGGGGTGAAIIHDLIQRGFTATLVERGELTSGTTGRHHGQLHSGARYAVGDREIARECMEEVRILQAIAPQALEMNYGLFVALTDEDVAFAPEFIQACREATIPVREIPLDQAFRMEPHLNPEIKMAVQVPDGTIDAWRLPLHFFATARAAGADIRTFTEVVGIHSRAGAVTGVRVLNHATQEESDIAADLVVSATGAWAEKVAALAGIHIPVTPAPGTMVAVKKRLNNMVVSHLHPAGDGDIIVPQRGLSIIGSTQWKTDDPDTVEVPRADIDYLTRRATELMPVFGETPFHAAWSASRPLAGASSNVEDGRKLSRDFIAIDHGRSDGVKGFISIIGGKATVLRAMGEKTVDLICDLVGVQEPCRTAETPLLQHRAFYNPHLVTKGAAS